VPSRNWLGLEHGFDDQIGTANFGHPRSYYPVYFPGSGVFEDEESAYLTDLLTDAAVDFIDSYDKPQPFRGGKMHETLYEGGSRVPFLFYWPGVTEPGTNST